MCKSAQEDLSGTFINVIGAIFCSSDAKGSGLCNVKLLNDDFAGLEPKDDGWMTSEVQRCEATAATMMAEAMLRMESH